MQAEVNPNFKNIVRTPLGLESPAEGVWRLGMYPGLIDLKSY